MNSTSMEAGSDDDDFLAIYRILKRRKKREDCHKHHRVDQHLQESGIL